MNFKRALSNHEAPKSTQTAPIRQARDERLALWLAHERFARARRSRLLFGRALGGEVLRVEPPTFLALGLGLALVEEQEPFFAVAESEKVSIATVRGPRLHFG